MLLIALALATMPKLIGQPLPGDLGMMPSLMDEQRPSATRIEVTVDPTGVPVRCEVTVSGLRSLDRSACEMMIRRARFAPAREGDGTPMFAVVRQDFTVNSIPALRRSNGPAETARRVDFAVPVAALPGTERMVVVDLLLTTDAAGRVGRCDVAATSGQPTVDGVACRQIASATFAPARDRAGNPVPALRQVSVAFAAGQVPQ